MFELFTILNLDFYQTKQVIISSNKVLYKQDNMFLQDWV